MRLTMKTVIASNAGISRGFGLLALICAAAALAQTPDAKPPQSPVPAAPASNEAPQPVATFKAATHLVTVEVVVRDHDGHPVPGLTGKDFQVFEEILPKKKQLPQKIDSVRFVSLADLKAGNQGRPQLPPGIYSNVLSAQKIPVPPTVLLVDGLNSETTALMQVHQQTARMLTSLPEDVPVAVFLMDRSLHLLQSFTTDPKLLREAAGKTLGGNSPGQQMDPLDDPDTLSATLEDVPANQLPPGALAALETFEQETYASTMDIRVRETLDSLRAIARYLAGYPGRKNLLWISSSFPIMLYPGGQEQRLYQDQIDETASALADAKVAVYPMDPGGVKTSSYFDASSRPRRVSDPRSMGQAIDREDTKRISSQESMQELAEQTGGRICVNNNDIADCVKTAVNDGSSYYELGYYPESGDWHGEFHRIVVKTVQSGVHLAYRSGYFATADASPVDSAKGQPTQADPRLQQAVCHDLLISTSIVLMARSLPTDQPDLAKFFLAIDTRALTFPPSEDGGHNLSITVAACSFDKTGKPLQYSQENVALKLTSPQFDSINAHHGVTHVLAIQPKPDTARVRLLVRDGFSGLMGSVEVPYESAAKTPATPAAAPNNNGRPRPSLNAPAPTPSVPAAPQSQ
jgi:VWFA-related protein